MRFPLFLLTVIFASNIAHADTSKATVDPYYLGASLVDQVYNFFDSEKMVDVRVTIIVNGAEANPLNSVMSISANGESKVYPVSLNLTSVKKVMLQKGRTANGEFNGMWVVIEGSRFDLNQYKTVPFTVSIKYTDNTGTLLDDLVIFN